MDEQHFSNKKLLPSTPSPCYSSWSLTPTQDAFLSLPKPLPSLNPRWNLPDQDALARQNTPALDARPYLTLCSSQYGCQTNAFRLGRAFSSRMFAIAAWL